MVKPSPSASNEVTTNDSSSSASADLPEAFHASCCITRASSANAPKKHSRATVDYSSCLPVAWHERVLIFVGNIAGHRLGLRTSSLHSLQGHPCTSEEEEVHHTSAQSHRVTPGRRRERNSGNFWLSKSWSGLHEGGRGGKMAMDMGGGGGAQANQAADLEEIETSVRIFESTSDGHY